MSMTIGTTPGVNEFQLHAMLTGQLKEATRLEGWEAFKNFFIKLLNHLPGMNLEDKEKNLRDIYNIIYGENTADACDKTHSVETLWSAIERLIHLMKADDVRAMEFEITHAARAMGFVIINNKREDVSSITDQYHTQSNQDTSAPKSLVIRVDGHTLPEIALTDSDLNLLMFNVVNNNMLIKSTHPAVYQLDPDKLIFEGCSVELAPQVKTATSHGFEVAKALEASRQLVKTPTKEISCLEEQKTQLEYYEKQIARLIQLKADGVGDELHSKSIDDALAKLNAHSQQQLKSNQQLNQKFVDNFVQECTDGLLQKGLLSKDAITTKLDQLSSLTPFMNTLFCEADSQKLQSIRPQLELVSEVADLQEQLQSSETQCSETVSQQPFLTLQGAIVDAEIGPLTKPLITALNAIQQTSTSEIIKEMVSLLEEKGQRANTEFLLFLEKAEADMETLLGNPDAHSNMDSETTTKMVARAKQLLEFTPNKATLISRAEIVHQQNIAITKIEKRLSEGLATLDDTEVLDFPRERVISELQTLNDKLPESQKKLSYQQRIDALNEDLLRRKIEIWQQRLVSIPESGRSEPSQKAVEALVALEDEVQQLNNIAGTSKQELKGLITDVINQHDVMKLVEAKLRQYIESNRYAIKLVVDDFSEQMKAIDDCPRKLALMEHINVLQTRNTELDAIYQEFKGVQEEIIKVDRFQASWSEDLSMTLSNVKTRAEALLKGETKNVLLRNIATSRISILEIQKLESIFSQTGKLLAKAAETNGHPSPNWTKAISQLKLAGEKLKGLPDSPRTKDLAARLDSDTNNALSLLKSMIAASPEGDKKYMAAREKEYKQLRDFINSMAAFLPNSKKLIETVKEIKHGNNFGDRSLLEKIKMPRLTSQ